jgi:hypothetical protein
MTIYELLQEAKRQWGVETVEAIKLEITEKNLIFSRGLIDSIGLNQDDTLDGNITFKMADYGKFLDEGVNGTSVQQGSQYSFRGNWKGTAMALTDWANAKGFNKWALAHKIQRDGLEPRRFFTSVIEQRLPQLGPKLELAYATYLNDMINNQQKP